MSCSARSPAAAWGRLSPGILRSIGSSQLKMLLGGEFAGRDGLRAFASRPRSSPSSIIRGSCRSTTPALEGQAFFCMKLIDGPSLNGQVGWYVGKPEYAARPHHSDRPARSITPTSVASCTATSSRATSSCRMPIFRARMKKTAERSVRSADYPLAGSPSLQSRNPQSATFDPANRAPYVTDFGLAKPFQDDGVVSHSCRSSALRRTWRPEQATGK